MIDIPQSFLFNLAITLIVGAMMFIYVGTIKRHVETKLETMLQIVQAITSEITIIKSLNNNIRSNTSDIKLNTTSNEDDTPTIELSKSADMSQNIELKVDKNDSSSEDESEDESDESDDEGNDVVKSKVENSDKIDVNIVDIDLSNDDDEDEDEDDNEYNSEKLRGMQVKDLKEIIESMDDVKGYKKSLKKNELIELILESKKSGNDDEVAELNVIDTDNNNELEVVEEITVNPESINLEADLGVSLGSSLENVGNIETIEALDNIEDITNIE